MIIADQFVWLHLPKTAGTSMNQMFRNRRIIGLQVDADDTTHKHDSVALRESRGQWRAEERQRFITCRRLEHWLISDWQHKRRHMDLPNLDFEPVRSGLTYSLRLGGTWVAADWWLQYFEIDERVISLRLEHLNDDLNQKLLPLLSPETNPFEGLPRENTKPKILQTQPSFNKTDLNRIASTNPCWNAWQKKIYGDEIGA